jgi:hypothetical protein
VLKRRITEEDGTNTGQVEDRLPALERPPVEFVDLPFGYVVAISFEEQPVRMCLHASVSGPWPRVAPNMVVCATIFNALDVPDEADDVWIEELLIDGRPSGRVFNATWLVEPSTTVRISKRSAAPRRASEASLPLVAPAHPRNRRRRTPAVRTPRRFAPIDFYAFVRTLKACCRDKSCLGSRANQPCTS